MPENGKKKVGILTDDEGNLSSIRLSMIVCVIAAIGLAARTMAQGTFDPGGNLVLIFLAAGIAPKTFQKFAEKMGKT